MSEIIEAITNDIQFRKSKYNSLLFSYKQLQSIIEEAELMNSRGSDLISAAPFQLIQINDSDQVKSLHEALQLRKDQIQTMLHNNLNMAKNLVTLMGFFHSSIAFYKTTDTNIMAEGNAEILKDRIVFFCQELERNEDELEQTSKNLENLVQFNDHDGLLDNFIELLKTEEIKHFQSEIKELKLRIRNNNKNAEEFKEMTQLKINENNRIFYENKNSIDLLSMNIKNKEIQMKSINSSIDFLSKTLLEEVKKLSKNQEEKERILLLYVQKETSDLQEIERDLLKLKSYIMAHYNHEEQKLTNILEERRRELCAEPPRRDIRTFVTNTHNFYLLRDTNFTEEQISYATNYRHNQLKSSICEIENLIRTIPSLKAKAIDEAVYQANTRRNKCQTHYQGLQNIESSKEKIDQIGLNNLDNLLEQKKADALKEKESLEQEYGKLLTQKNVLQEKNQDLEIFISESQRSIKLRLEELDDDNRNIKTQIDELNLMINNCFEARGYHSIQPLIDYATALAIFIENALKFKQKIKVFQIFVANYKNCLILEKEFLLRFMKDDKAASLDTAFNDLNFKEIGTWAQEAFPKNLEFQKIVAENYDFNSLIEIFNLNDEKILKEELCLNTTQFKSLKIKLNNLTKDKNLVSIKLYVKNLLENMIRISQF